MTASPPKVNGHARPPAPQVWGDWQPIGAAPTTTPSDEPQPGSEAPATQPGSGLVAQAQAEAVRAQAWAEAEERRIAAEAEKEAALKRAEAEAKAIRIRAEEDARKLRLANDRAERKAAEEAAASEARIAEHNRRRDEAEQVRRDAARAADEERAAADEAANEIKAADDKWRAYAIRFAIVCGIVSLPVQMSFFWNPKAPWMAAAPIMLEGAAWVVHRGARAAAVSKRPVWHYRTIVWLLALLAAGVNLYHGLHSFDPGTAVATAFASIAGPGVWDLHEHGRIRKRDGVPTRRERRAAKKVAERLAAEQAEKELRESERQAYREKAAREAAEALDEARRSEFPDVHQHAMKLAADLGETAITEAIWKRAKLDVDGALPGESADIFRMRNAAEARVEAARQKRPVNTLSKNTNAQRAIQTPRSSYKPVPPRRKPGDTPRYDRVAGHAHGELLRRKQTAKNTRPNAS